MPFSGFDPKLLTLPLHHKVRNEDRKKRSLWSLIRLWPKIHKFKSCRIWGCFLNKFYKAKKSKNVEIVFSIPKSGSISIKIRQPFFWMDPYLPHLMCNNSENQLWRGCYKLRHFTKQDMFLFEYLACFRIGMSMF